ncbi:AraC family transcriptional regulator [Chitinasiproducens palmae]|uniref:AraC-type DNA-binding protein n=1 Tax=Chitinasiproducens palmae TaxID=1770053 RepID=A0A1H2PKH6_9BURK|nr:helix-turn-helix transcriptional regulator [Chitinasiproducens palmae]SDV46920.1 AraC-type DNA-binding protein [Chitinasiproducens palmae]
MKEFLVGRYPKPRTPQLRPVIAKVVHLQHGDRLFWHQHEQAQMVVALTGIVRVLTPKRTWTLPASRALWIPSSVEHEIHALGALELCSLYIEPEALPLRWREPGPVVATALIRELMHGISAGGPAYDEGGQAALMATLILKILGDLTPLPESGLPLPRDSRLQAICAHLMSEPSSAASLDIWGQRLGASSRTLARRFKSETGLTFGQWRQHLRVAEAMSRLAQGEAVSRIAAELGYRSASAFIAMFRQVVGDSPRRYGSPA